MIEPVQWTDNAKAVKPPARLASLHDVALAVLFVVLTLGFVAQTVVWLLL